MEAKMKSAFSSKKRIAGLIGLVIFAMIFIFACLSGVLPFGAMIVGTFGYAVYPFLLIFMFLSLAAFLGFSYRRNPKPSAYTIFAI